MKTPVALLIFNRPDTTKKVFDVIRQAKPSKLLIVADGPRADRLGEADKCAAARTIVDEVDWDCEVLKNYSDVNMGCKLRVSSGLDWVFEIVEEAIILEDDCVPHPTFFRFCEELLERYRDDKRIMSISGDNFQFGRSRTEYSYYFSRYNHCWGWASWRRAWQHYDVEMKLWPKVKDEGKLKDLLSDLHSVIYWTRIFQSTYEERINSWAFRWTFACWIQSGLTVLPNVNLVTNIGFNTEATHTINGSSFANMPVEAIRYPLHHSPFIIRNVQADAFTQNNVFTSRILSRIRKKFSKILR